MQKKTRDYFNIEKHSSLKPGKWNKITDIEGVKVGHSTLADGDIQTGVTVVMPHENNIFKNKLRAAVHVINGFGKSIGLVQIRELGSIESPIVLTNTLNVGTVSTALIKNILAQNEDIGGKAGSFNSVVLECNDQYLNNLRKLAVQEKDYFKAKENIKKDFREGAVGAGRGMSCYGLKGGIGSSSRRFKISEDEYHLGALVLSNFGKKKDFLLYGKSLSDIMPQKDEEEKDEDREYKSQDGSVIVILATDLPLSSRQLKRLCVRAGAGLAKTGTYISNGSGDIVLAFSTADYITEYDSGDFLQNKILKDRKLDIVFKAAVESTQEAVYNSMVTAESVTGFKGRSRESLKNLINNMER
ncbi:MULTISPECIES: P1 family peptidase [unclassified Halanaerobium]|uniref:DmpA family aminopeptidase n=1 Tax=unclassified Halanaerobium TaxID=2641197 RepID=UPI000DF2F2DF|nr:MULTISPECIES: P1 family peptidase [unclassified Halanaerobium]RCW43753.1 D-aminopeptidase [Halanaerobium sp. MA284_MarDTE_T2]RCW89178.1 D-aminopeptidase [Halanaerobium sp. DL-01]